MVAVRSTNGLSTFCRRASDQHFPTFRLSGFFDYPSPVSKKKKRSDSAGHTPRIVNRRARHDYHVLENVECGIVLVGSEVKSIRNGQVSLAEGFARVEPGDMGLYLYNVDIAAYAYAGPGGHDPKRRRKLLAHKRQIHNLFTHTSAKGTTLVPLAMYFSRGIVKVEIGVAHGKREYDKRQDLKTREADRAIRAAMTRKRL